MEHFTAMAQNKSSEELLKMVYEWDAWSPALLQEVEKELLRRNLLPSDVVELREQRINAEAIVLSKGQEASFSGLLVGWILCFGLVGIGVGYHYAFSKIPSKYTSRIFYKYDDKSRSNGRILFYTSLAISGTCLLVKLIPEYGF